MSAPRIATCLSSVLALCSCAAAPTAPASASATARSGVAYRVAATQAGLKWTYTVTAAGPAARFDRVRFHSDKPIGGCTVALAQPSPASGVAPSVPDPQDVVAAFMAGPGTPADAKAWSAGTFSLSCDMTNGAVTVAIEDVSGAAPEQVVLGPLIGPTA